MKFVLMLLLAAGWARAAPPLTGFPFTDEALTYKIGGPPGVSLGDARFSARHSASGWAFDLKVNAGVPGFAVKDSYSAHTNADFCSADFSRQWEHGSRKGHEEESVDRSQESAVRTTIGGGGGKSEFPVSDCAKDALSLFFYTRREMGQGRVPAPQQMLFGGLYDIRMDYTGAETIQSGGQPAITDKLLCTVKGPSSTFTFEVYFARDAARTPLLVKVPFAGGNFSMELIH